MEREKISLRIRLVQNEPPARAATQSIATGSSASGATIILDDSPSLSPSRVPATLQANSRAAQAATRVNFED